MKIAIGINSFESNENRFKLANQSYEKLSSIDCVEIFDIQKKGVKGKFKTLDRLDRTSKDVIPNSDRELPFVNDLFNIMADLDSDYFVVTNADVMISPRLIRHILDADITALPCSRLDVMPIKDINDPMIPVRWEIGGFDTFCFKTSWYKKHHWLFEDFLMGKPWYDHHYAGLMKIFGNNNLIGNKNPAMCLHEHHGFGACSPGNPEYDFNTDQFNKSELCSKYRYVWDDYFRDFLKVKRQPYFYFLEEAENESEVELNFFKQEIDKLKPLIEEERKKHE